MSRISGRFAKPSPHSAAVTTQTAALQEVIRAALRQAGVSASVIGSLQLHGTGTALGDPVEGGAAFAALRLPHKLAPGAVTQQALAMTALKSRIGHTEAAAGACGLLSSLYALQQGVDPGQPTLLSCSGLQKLKRRVFAWSCNCGCG